MNLHLCPLQRWTSTHDRVPDAAAHFRGQIDLAAELGCAGINIPESDKLDYLDDPTGNIMTRTRDLHTYATGLGLRTTQSGPKLAKHWFHARRLTLPVLTDPAEGAAVGLSKALDSTGRAYFPDLAGMLNSEDLYRVLRVRVLTSQPGTVYLLNAEEGIVNKFTVSPGTANLITHIPLPGLALQNVVFVSSGAKDGKVTFPGLYRNDLGQSVDAENEWVGTSRDGFLHCRIADPSDFVGRSRTMLEAGNYLPDIQQLVVADEINSPLGYGLDSLLYPHGWPQWFGEYLADYALTCKTMTGDWPILMQPDPRPGEMDLRYNRCCAPVPEGSPADPLYYLARRVQRLTVGIWGERAGVSFWWANYHRVIRYGFWPLLMIYAGKQSVLQIADALGLQTLRETPLAVFYWETELPAVAKTVREIRELLG